MKKVAKKGWCITAAVMAVSVIVCIFCFVRWERKSSDLSFQFEETTYDYKNEYCLVNLSYPQMVGSRDKEKESKINRLIEDDVKKLMELAAPDEENGYIFEIGTFLYEIEYADDKFISISYDGYFKQNLPKALGAMPLIMNPTSKGASSALKALGSMPGLEQVMITKNKKSGKYQVSFKVRKLQMTTGSYLHSSQKQNKMNKNMEIQQFVKQVVSNFVKR